jgi:hypothetical protein
MQKKRDEKRMKMEEELGDLKNLETLKEDDPHEFKEVLLAKGFSSQEELIKRINYLNLKLNISKPIADPVKEEEKFNLLGVPDEQLTAEQLK